MPQHLGSISLLVPSYAEGLDFYARVLGFEGIEDTEIAPDKRWVLVAPPGSRETRILLAEASGEEQQAAVGRQAGGRVFLFLHTDDFHRDHRRYLVAGVRFLESPREEAYGTVAIFADPFGNKWDLLQPRGRT